ncbi:MAG: hypothetical protein FJ119_01170 [Deltaproteobacteria bacterium]|nr:hypothetical protein [Deltaproteobacteria bacterium]
MLKEPKVINDGVFMATDSKDIDIQKYFEELRVLIATTDKAKKEIDRLVAPDFSLFSVLWPDEMRLSNLIAKLLDPSAAHGQGAIFLYEFLDFIEELAREDSSAYSSIEIIKKSWNGSSNLKVSTEQATDLIAASQRRMDIVIGNHECGVMIENKPWTIDQKDQLKDYHEYLQNKYPKAHIMVYLSGTGGPPSQQSLSKKDQIELKKQGSFVVLSYRPHLVDWINRCLFVAEPDRVRWILKDFLRYIELNFTQPQDEVAQ